MMDRMHRREFVIAAGIAALATLAGVGHVPGHAEAASRETLIRDALRAVLDEFFPDTQIADADLDAFAADFIARFGALLRREVKARSGGFDATRRAEIHALFRHRVVQAFLISTDYFDRKAEGRETVRFMRSSDPYIAGCGNPVARFGFD